MDDPWDELAQHNLLLKDFVSKGKAEKLNSRGVRDAARGMAQYFFRTVRPNLIETGIEESDLTNLDRALQDINSLAQGANRRSSYKKVLQVVSSEITRITPMRDRMIGANSSLAGRSLLSHLQQQILATLEGLVPGAALSYRQTIIDLTDDNRISFRGCAVELREALREVVDHLAPDVDVRSATGFQLEKGRDKPTMRQKVQFILKNRGQGETAISASKDAAEHIDIGPDKVARSLYNRGSASTHISTSRQEVMNLLRYTEALLAELLQV